MLTKPTPAVRTDARQVLPTHAYRTTSCRIVCRVSTCSPRARIAACRAATRKSRLSSVRVQAFDVSNEPKQPLQRFPWEQMNLPDLAGKVAIVTGGNSGVGYGCVEGLAAKGAHVIIASRNPDKGHAAAKEVNDLLGADRVEFMEVNLASFRSIEAFVEEFKRRKLPLHILINDAGTMMPKEQQGHKTPEGFEVTMGTNYFGPMYLTHLLIDDLKASRPSRIVNLGSCSEYGRHVPWEDLKGEHRTQSDFDAYGSTKVLLMMAAKALNEKYSAEGVEVFSAHPGVTRTGLFPKSDIENKISAKAVDLCNRLFGQSVERGASPILYAAASPDVTGQGGSFFGGPVGNIAWTGATNLDQFKERTSEVTTQAIRDPEECRKVYQETIRILEDIIKKPLPA